MEFRLLQYCGSRCSLRTFPLTHSMPVLPSYRNQAIWKPNNAQISGMLQCPITPSRKQFKPALLSIILPSATPVKVSLTNVSCNLSILTSFLICTNICSKKDFKFRFIWNIISITNNLEMDSAFLERFANRNHCYILGVYFVYFGNLCL